MELQVLNRLSQYQKTTLEIHLVVKRLFSKYYELDIQSLTVKSHKNDVLLGDCMYDPYVSAVQKLNTIFNMTIGTLIEEIAIIHGNWRRDKSGSDLVNEKFKVECKKSYNTANSSSKKSDRDKLISNSKLQGVYAILNTSNGKGFKRIINHNEKKIIELGGDETLKFLIGNQHTFLIPIYSNLSQRVYNKCKRDIQNYHFKTAKID